MRIFNIITLSVSAFILSFISGCNPESINPVDLIDELSEYESIGLVYMREEEKLARDAYIYLFEMNNNQVFNNISYSEQRHMDEILSLLEKYNITDPSLSTVGEFSNETLQQLYDDLIAQGSDSEIAALTVGATIEDLDIKDLEEFRAETANPDIIHVYNFLMCGSRNHLRSFVSQLNNYGVTYTPQFITQEEFDSIVAGDKEKCGQSYN